MVVSNIYIPKFSTKLSVLFFQNRFSSLNTFLIKLEVPLSRFDRKVPYKTSGLDQTWSFQKFRGQWPRRCKADSYSCCTSLSAGIFQLHFRYSSPPAQLTSLGMGHRGGIHNYNMRQRRYSQSFYEAEAIFFINIIWGKGGICNHIVRQRRY